MYQAEGNYKYLTIADCSRSINLEFKTYAEAKETALNKIDLLLKVVNDLRAHIKAS